MTLKEKEQKPTIAELLAELKIIRESEPVEMEIPERRDGPNRQIREEGGISHDDFREKT